MATQGIKLQVLIQSPAMFLGSLPLLTLSVDWEGGGESVFAIL